MKLSLIFELLLIFILLAFAASKSVRKQKNNKKAVTNRNDSDKLEDNSINKFCKCSESYCNCCREFQVPVVNLNGPGCASLMYINGDKMSVSLSFGKKVITNRTLSSRKPTPVCLPLPGGLSKFCGRVYNIARAGEEFRACLGLELQSKSAVEAAVRVSCFKFGPRGVTSEPADPLPLVPQGEKAGEDDDDDDEEDDFGLGDDDDDDGDDDEEDDDDEGELDAINDVDSADYTGFSLLGEDLLGDLFGSSGSKKTNKNKKKQAPTPTTTTTTTTTRRPRPSRRPSRKPSTRTTTPKPTRTTTLKVRPAKRRPTRKPSRRRPSKKPTTSITAASPTTATVTTPTTPLISIPVITPAPTPIVTSTERRNIIQTDLTFEPIIGVNENIKHLPATTPSTVTNFEDPGLEMSLAHITGQLSVMPVTPIIPSTAKESSKEMVNYEKVETITPRMPSTVSFTTSSEEKVNDDIVQIVQELDSQSVENIIKEPITAEETRGHKSVTVSSDYYAGLSLPKKKQRSNFNFEDLDVLQLSDIGETVGDQLGLFGRNKRQNKHRDGKKESSNDYTDMLGLEDFLRKSNNENKNKKDRRRQNKMMRGEWSHV